jgi:methylmalonyl-CoA mutase
MDAIAPAEQDWRERVEKALKGKPFARRPGRWRVMMRVDHPEARAANVLALEDIANGADGLEIIFAGAAEAHGYGVATADAAELSALFDGLVAPAIELNPGAFGEKAALAIADLSAADGDASGKDIAFGLDPIGLLARHGSGADDALARALDCAITLKGRGFKGPFLAADGRVVHAAGGSQAQELAFALAAALTYARGLQAKGFVAAEALAAVSFRLSVDADEFLGLAKVRALRLLWARVGEACGVSALAPRIHASTAWRMLGRRDAYVNVLRGAIACCAAGLGGADSIAILPFTQARGLPDAFARRLARNAQLVLLRESHLGFVEDPAAGSGAFETLTQALCTEAWTSLQKLEGAGGIVAALTTGAPQAEIAEVARARASATARRIAPITGVSDFADLGERAADVLNAAQPAFPIEGGQIVVPLIPHRLAEPFESLRDASDAALARNGRRPSIFLASLGPIVATTARLTFARSLFEAGGIEALASDSLSSAEDAAKAFLASGAPIACLCSSDAIYATMAEDCARALRDAGARAIILAGRADDAREAALRAAGVTDFVFAGCDALAALRAAQAKALG